MTVGAPTPVACRLRVAGVVQGVGFRPYVHRIAARHQVTGWIRNESGDVHVHAEGDAAGVAAFVAELPRGLPPLARIDRLDRAECPPTGATEFTIVASLDDGERRQPVVPDVAVCAACEAELRDPADRRYRYPFTTCTDCGPRYTVIESLPYDRERTTLRRFPLCARCAAEYAEPGNRRHHAESIACPSCGPRAWLVEPAQGRRTDGPDAFERAGELLRGGRIVAVRGIGGFHLAVLAAEREAVRRLRRRKRRDAKPLAVMCATLVEAERLAVLGAGERALLTSAARPIVVVRRRRGAPLAAGVAPGLGTVGLMLAYSPLHLLLLEAAGAPLVMTSGNLSDEPLAVANDEALRRLGGIADAFLLHDRDIVAPVDDSVVRDAHPAPVLLRRARGWSPLPLELPVPAPVPLVALGAQLKSTFTLAEGTGAYVSPHVGDLDDLTAADAFAGHLARYRALYRIEPRVAVRDAHPGYLSTRLAEELGLGVPLVVQHHHAHVAAVLAEHGECGPALGVAFDGTGYGSDGAVWGAEFLLADLTGFTRLAGLRYAPLPGGDRAIREPWRVLLGYASLPGGEALRASVRAPRPAARAVAERQLAAGLNAPLASSMGRLFDAAAAVIGVSRAVRYEGEAAMRLEALAGRRRGAPLPLPVVEERGVRLLDPLPFLLELAARAARGESRRDLAAGVHDGVAEATARLAAALAAEHGIRTIVLSGGVFQNVRLLGAVSERLADRHRLLVARRLGPNDGAISYGQAAVAAARLAAGMTA